MRDSLKDEFLNVFSNTKLFAFDLDGTTVLSSKPIDGVREFLECLNENGKNFCFLTNNSSKTNASHAEFLSRVFGFNVRASSLLSSLDALEDFLENQGIKRIYPFLSDEVKGYLRTKFEFDCESPQLIVVGFNTDAEYDQFVDVSKLIFKGIPYVLVHPDLRCPTDFGYIPDAGSFAKMFEFTTGQKPIWIGGKPNPIMAKSLEKRFKVKEEEIIYVGDRLYTDVEMVRKTNMYGVLVLTGETSLEEYEAYAKRFDLKKLFIFKDMKEMRKAISLLCQER